MRALQVPHLEWPHVQCRAGKELQDGTMYCLRFAPTLFGVRRNERERPGKRSHPSETRSRGDTEILGRVAVGSQVAIKSTGGWYWLVDEMEAAGLRPQLANAHEAKQRMAGRNKTDKLDARGLAMELLMGTLPSIWIPPAELRDLRALMRTRLALRA